jgi:hypothetical protein
MINFSDRQLKRLLHLTSTMEARQRAQFLLQLTAALGPRNDVSDQMLTSVIYRLMKSTSPLAPMDRGRPAASRKQSKKQNGKVARFR